MSPPREPPRPEYRVLEKLAAGGIADIFLIERLEAGRAPLRLALKRMRGDLHRDAAFAAMIADEIGLGRLCEHPNLVKTLDSGQIEGQPYVILEYVEGLDLARARDALLERGERFTRAQAVGIAIELCKGLAYLHALKDARGTQLRVVHRDVTPPNVLIGVDGAVKLCDFGFAKSRVQRAQTEPGLIKGKLAYLSPEAAAEQAIDQRADLFGVGIMLWEMLAMRRLFHAPTDYETFKRAQKSEIPALGPLGEIDPVLEEIVHKCLARDPNARFQSAEALYRALAAYADWQELACELGPWIRRLKSPPAQIASHAHAERPSSHASDTA